MDYQHLAGISNAIVFCCMHFTTHVAELADEMAGISREGIPLVPGLHSARLARDLDAAAVELRQHDAEAPAIESGTKATEKLPAPLRGILAAAAVGADGRGLLAALQRLAVSARDDQRMVRAAIAYPVVVCILAGLGIVWLWTWSVPPLEHLEASSVSLSPTVPRGALVMQWLWRPALVGLMVVIAIAVASWFIARRRWKPAGARAALACDVRAALIAVECPPADKSRIINDICGAGGAASEPPWPIGPLAAHAETYESPTVRAEALRAVSRFYLAIDDCRRRGRSRLLPVAGVAVAGFVVLLYGVALFGPLTETLKTVAEGRPGFARGADRP